MSVISEEKKKEVYELVEKQKKAKVSWVAVITQLTDEEIKTIAWDIGLIIDKDQIMLQSETKEGNIQAKIQEEREIPLQELTPAEIQIERKKQEETQIARRKWQIKIKNSRFPFFLPFVIGYFALHVIIIIILSILVPAGIAPRVLLIYGGLFLSFTLPIGIVIGFLISALTGYILKRRGISKSENICPSCEAKIDHDEEICVFCGTELSKV